METPGHTNRLIHETGSYLRQHAHNPVDWYPWGEEALEKAKREDKPIFLSIGYSSCHWCHVMARESFENEETARLMNEWFVNIKVDREERPDLDAIYMKSVIQLVGQGGWPISLFLTPDQEPYFGGTYFPPAPRYNRPGFPQILEQAHDLYRNQKDQVGTRTTRILEKLKSYHQPGPVSGMSYGKMIEQAVDLLAEKYDSEQGGFGQGMKFPEPMVYTLLLRHWVKTGADHSLNMLDKSLTRMAEGGMYDHLGGGFHRYSTDKNWQVPHFEKMLYDNALLAKLYFEMAQATKQEIYRAVPSDILAYVLREMTSPEGGFYSSQDADTEGEEGKFYTWQLREVLNLLGPRNAKVFARAFGITSRGNFAGGNVLRVGDSMEKISAEEGIPIFEVNHIIQTGKKNLLGARERRVKPERDEKIITAWNGLMITAFATGFTVLRDKSWLAAATRCAGFLWDRMWTGKGLLRIYKDGQVKINGCLEDYAYFMEGLISLYEASFDPTWIERACTVADRMIEEFGDETDGGFFMTGVSHEKLILRLRTGADEAVPSANAVAALSLLRLGRLTGREVYTKQGEGTVRAFQPFMEKSPAAFTGLLSAADFLESSPVEVVFAGSLEDPALEEMIRTVHEDYRPNKTLLWNKEEQTRDLLPLAEGRAAVQGKATVYLCRDQTCHPPVHSGKALTHLLEPPPEIRLNIYDEGKHAEEIRLREEENFLNAMSQIFKHSGFGKGR